MELDFSFIKKITDNISNDNKKSKILNFIFIFIGIIFIILGMLVFASESEKIADNVLFGETAAYGAILFIIGLVIIFGTLFLRLSFDTPLDETLDNIKNIENKKSKSSVSKEEEEDKKDENADKEEIIVENTEETESKYDNYKKNIGKNLKSAFKSDKIRNINNSTFFTEKKNSKKNKENKKDKGDSISFDDAINSVDDLLDD